MLTNRHNLPQPLVNAIANDPYSRGESDISVTQLIQPPQIRFLMKGREVTEDAADNIWRLFGQAMHSILERAYPGTAMVEQRLFTRVLGWVVSGQFDVYDDAKLTDYKVTSVYSRDGKLIWEQQLNLLAALCRRNDMPVSRLEIVAIFRDWRPKEAWSKDDYPPSPVGVIPALLWTEEEAEEYLEHRVMLHQMEVPPLCTDEDRWMQPSKHALMQKGRKRAIRLFDTKPEIELGKGQYWEHRQGAYRRCEDYCPASTFCEQNQNEIRRRKQDGSPEQEDVADAPGHIETGQVCG